MKGIRFVTSIAVTIAVVLCSTSVSGVTTAQVGSDLGMNIKPAISQELKEKLKVADEDDLLPVTIQLKDSIDMNQVTTQAVEKANITMSEVDLMKIDTQTMTDEINERHQDSVMKITDRIRKEKVGILREFYINNNAEFIAKHGIPEERVGSLGTLTPFIRNVLLTPNEIITIALDASVELVHYTEDAKCSATASVSDAVDVEDAYEMIGGDVSVIQGYSGEGIRVGVIDTGLPILSKMGTDAENIYFTESAVETIHTTIVCGEIKKMAPDCSIYVAAVNSTVSSAASAEIINKISTLISEYNVHVINLSYGVWHEEGLFSKNDHVNALEIDRLVRNYDVSIVVGSGNKEDNINAGRWVNSFAMGVNAIAVGSVEMKGTDPSAPGAYRLADYSAYNELNGSTNKPDVCAPGTVKIYIYWGWGTSFAAPLVTGTIVQMLDRNSALIDKPETIKAAIIASAYHNAGTDMTYVSGTKSSNQEGAGVVDAEFCYWVARNGRRAHIDTVNGQREYTYDVYCDTTTLPFRVACTWRAIVADKDPLAFDFDLEIYKNGVLVGYSRAYVYSEDSNNVNYDVIELSPEVLSTYGNGYYQVKVKLYENVAQAGGIRIGLAWEQPWIES